MSLRNLRIDISGSNTINQSEILESFSPVKIDFWQQVESLVLQRKCSDNLDETDDQNLAKLASIKSKKPNSRLSPHLQLSLRAKRPFSVQHQSDYNITSDRPEDQNENDHNETIKSQFSNTKIWDSFKFKRTKSRYQWYQKIINPNDPRKIMWDLFICVLVVYSVIIIPFRIGFHLQLSLPELVFDYMIDGIFLIDMILYINTSYYDVKAMTFIHDRYKIILNYAKFWFWVDIISTIPFDDIFGTIINTDKLGSIRVIKIMRLIRLVKIYKLQTLSDGFEKMNINPLFVNLMILLLQIGFITHLFACFWHYVGLIDHTNMNWISINNLENGSLNANYVASLYWTLATMLAIGFGDIHATNTAERLYSIAAILTGGVIFGALIGRVGKLIENRNPTAVQRKLKLNQLKLFLEGVDGLPLKMKIVAKDSYTYFLSKKTSFDESSLYNDLPKPIMINLLSSIHSKTINSIELFKEYDRSFVIDLLIHAKHFNCNVDFNVVEHGDVCTEIIFVTSGIVRINGKTASRDDKREVKKFVIGFSRDGNYFCDFEYFKHSLALATYTSITNCEMLSVSYDIITNTLDKISTSECAERFKTELLLRYQNYLHIINLSEDNKTRYDFVSSKTTSRSLFKKSKTTSKQFPDANELTKDMKIDDGLNPRNSNRSWNSDHLSIPSDLNDNSDNNDWNENINNDNNNDHSNNTIINNEDSNIGSRSQRPSLPKIISSSEEELLLEDQYYSIPQRPLLAESKQNLSIDSIDSMASANDINPEVIKTQYNQNNQNKLPLSKRLSTLFSAQDSTSSFDSLNNSFVNKNTTPNHKNNVKDILMSSTKSSPRRPTLARQNTSTLAGRIWLNGKIESTIKLERKYFEMKLLNDHEAVQSQFTKTYNVKRFNKHTNEYEIIRDYKPENLNTLFLIDPEGKNKTTWDILILILIVYSVTTIPVEIGFSTTIFSGSDVTNLVVDMFFMMDIIITFRTPYTENFSEYIIISSDIIATNYIQSWFFIDLASSVPFDFIFSSISSLQDIQSTSLIKIIRAIRLLKLGRILKLTSHLERIEDYLGLSPAVFSLLKLLTTVFFIAHILSCIWWGVSSILSPDPWYTQYDSGLLKITPTDSPTFSPIISNNFVNNNFINSSPHRILINTADIITNFKNSSLWVQYVTTLYWAFSTVGTVGYGDIIATNTSERILVIILMLIGASVFAYTISKVALISDTFSESASGDERISQVTDYLHETKVPSDLSNAVLKHYRLLYSQFSLSKNEAILSFLPMKLKNNILYLRYRKPLTRILFFSYIKNQSIQLYIFKMLSSLHFYANEFIAKEGREVTEVFFIDRGSAVQFKRMKNNSFSSDINSNSSRSNISKASTSFFDQNLEDELEDDNKIYNNAID
eukprot:gene11631-15580_t